MFGQLPKSAQSEIYYRKALGRPTPGLVERMLYRRGSDYWTLRCLGIKTTEGFPTIIPEGFDDLVIFFFEKSTTVEAFVEFEFYPACRLTFHQ